MLMLEVYRDFVEKELAIPVIPGLQEREPRSSPGRCAPTRIEAMMGDGKALQAGTSHNLGQNFARAFDIQFQDTRRRGQVLPGRRVGASARA